MQHKTDLPGRGKLSIIIPNLMEGTKQIYRN